MKITLTASLLVAITPIHAFVCTDGAYVLTFVKVFGINAASITCNGLPGKFATGQTPKDPNDPAQAYFNQLEAHGKCGVSSPCSSFCTVELAEDPFEALNTLLGEQETRCKAAGGTYKSKIV
jgi:hypothetical protein